MTWTTLKPAPRGHIGAEIRFAIRHHTAGGSHGAGIRLTLSIRPDIAKKAGFSPGDKITMQIGNGDKTSDMRCRLADIAGPGAVSYRHGDSENGRGLVEFTCTGNIREAWTDNATGMVDLEFISVAKGEIVFAMPEWEGGEE
jgi:hypothetical protein